jgi:hypothetical protein
MKNSRTVSQGSALPTVVAVVALVLVIGVVGVSLLTGFLKVNTDSLVSQETGLCSDAIAIHNRAYAASSPQEYAAKLAESARSAAGAKDAQTDPNCVFIQFANAAYLGNKDDVEKYSKQLRSLYNEKKYITGEFTRPLGISDIESTATSLTAPSGTDSASGSQGNG